MGRALQPIREWNMRQFNYHPTRGQHLCRVWVRDDKTEELKATTDATTNRTGGQPTTKGHCFLNQWVVFQKLVTGPFLAIRGVHVKKKRKKEKKNVPPAPRRTIITLFVVGSKMLLMAKGPEAKPSEKHWLKEHGNKSIRLLTSSVSEGVQAKSPPHQWSP